MKLIAIPFSHYCEKARWALEHFNVAYEQASYLPMLHMPGVMWQTRMRLGQSEKTSTPMSTPIVVTDEGEVIHDSAKIVRWASEKYADERTTLYPAGDRAEIEAVEDELGQQVGPHARRYAYFAVLGAPPGVLSRMVRDNAPTLQRMAFAATRPMMVAALRRSLGVHERGAARSLERLQEVFDGYAKRLEGRRYLVGDRFTAADLTLAALAAPVVGIGHEHGYGAKMPGLEDLTDEPRQVMTALRDGPVGRHIHRIYAEHRRP